MAQKGTGATATFSSGFIAELLDLNHRGIERPSIPTSHFGTSGGQTFIPGDTYDPGEVVCEIAWAPETAAPITGAAETVTVTHVSAGTGGTSTWAATGFLTGFEIRAPFEERSEATATIKLSGDITVTP